MYPFSPRVRKRYCRATHAHTSVPENQAAAIMKCWFPLETTRTNKYRPGSSVFPSRMLSFNACLRGFRPCSFASVPPAHSDRWDQKVASCLRSHKWDVAYGVLQKMQRQGMVPLDLRPGRFTTAPGEPGEARDRVLHLLRHLTSLEGVRSPPPLSSPERRAGAPFGSGGDDGSGSGSGSSSGSTSGGGVAGRVSRHRGEETAGSTKLHRAQQQQQQQQLRIVGAEKAGTGAGLSEKNGRGRSAAAAGGETRAAASRMAGVSQQGGDGGGGEEETAASELLAAGVRPREEDFLAELKAAAKTKSWEHALELLDGMREARYQPRPGAYACAIRYAGGAWQNFVCIARSCPDWCACVCVVVILPDEACMKSRKVEISFSQVPENCDTLSTSKYLAIRRCCLQLSPESAGQLARH